MVALKKTEFMTGKLYWTKVLGDPVPNYERTAREWTFEFEPDEAGLAVLKAHKLTDRLKDKYEDRGKFLSLKKSELSKDGNANPPIRVYNDNDEEWDRTKLIGNGSTADVKLDIRDYGVGKKKGIYPVAIRVTELIPYQSSEFGSMGKVPDTASAKADKKQAKKDTFKEDFNLPEDELNDEIPA